MPAPVKWADRPDSQKQLVGVVLMSLIATGWLALGATEWQRWQGKLNVALGIAWLALAGSALVHRLRAMTRSRQEPPDSPCTS
jgi:hypothetical protein